MKGWRIASGMSLLALALGSLTVMAQEATPVVDAVALPVIPDPSDCVATPRTFAELRDLIGTPEPFMPPPPTAPPRPTTPPSAPADPETIGGIVETAYHFIACVNAGDMPRGYALYTDEFVRSSVFLDPAMERPPVSLPPDERVTLLDVVYTRVYPDGRVGAVVVIDDPLAPSPAEPYFFIFRNVGGEWLFDEWPTTTFLAGSGDDLTAIGA